MIFRVFDIETAPLPDLWQPPEDDPGKFPPLFAHQVIAVAYADLDLIPAPGAQELQPVHMGVAYGDDEKEILTAWSDLCARSSPALVSWNGRKFDGPCMAVRSMTHGVPYGWWYQSQPNYRYRYGEAHIDLMESLLDYTGGGMSLDGITRACGLQGKGSVDGSKVADMAKAKQFREIAEYCLDDVVMTAKVFARFQALRGRIAQPAVPGVDSRIDDLRALPKMAAFEAG